MTKEAIETPSGKGAGDENFPVGSWLLPARLRPHVAHYYRFARAIDDIADNPDLSAEEKVRRLERFAQALEDPQNHDPALATARSMRASLEETGVSVRHCLDLIATFKQDAVKLRYRDWPDLMNYCAYSANPVGRYLLDLHGEDAADYRFADPLCSALQVLNHLQDCQTDYRQLDRVYLPGDWLATESLDVEVLDRAESPPGLRRVIDRCLDGVDTLMVTASRLPWHLRSTRLATESQLIVRLAKQLSNHLRTGDPLAGRVALTKGDFSISGFWAVFETPLRRLAGRPAQSTGLTAKRS